jgi:hypothetical protein
VTQFHDAQTGIGGNREDLQKLLIWFNEPQAKVFADMLRSWLDQKAASFRQCKDDDDRGRFRCQVECQALERVRSFPQKLQEALNREASVAPKSNSVED